MAYHDSLYDKDRSPMCIYMPSNEVLFKLMRACIGCEKAEDLWIYTCSDQHNDVPKVLNVNIDD